MSDPPPGPGRRYRPIRFATWAVAIAVLVTLPAGILTGTTNFGGRVDPGNLLPQPLPAQSYDWPELHQNPMLTGYTANSTINATNAGTLGVEWDTYLYGSALDSPVIAYDPILHETLAYIGTETGNVLGINIANGQIVWGLWLGSPIRSSPLVYGGSVYIGTFVNPAILRINDTTGAVQARIISPGQLEATPTLATPPGGIPTLYFPTLDSAHSGPLLALNAATLAVEWEFTDYNQTAGSWDSASYAVNANGIPEVLFGTDNPDSSVYAVNALTGARLWWFQCYEPNDGDYDVAAGVTVSPPGGNGFADGVAYAINKISYAYALDLTTGKLIWEVNFDKLAGHSGGVSRSTSALLGTNLVFGYPVGVLDLNAITGKLVWDFKDSTKTESLASPDIVGPSGNGIGVTGDVGGYVDVVSLATGAKLYSYQTGGYIAGSPAVSGDNIVFASSNGFLYDFALGGGNEAVLPTTRISSPVDG
ncbi:MAG: PQQ-binding-like beta-propeller repeat protein, partial [Thermoplasmata archaeon]